MSFGLTILLALAILIGFKMYHKIKGQKQIKLQFFVDRYNESK